jgi:hypothetical protein
MELRGDGLDSLRIFFEKMATDRNFGWLGHPEHYTRDLPNSLPDMVVDPNGIVDTWRRSLETPGVG